MSKVYGLYDTADEIKYLQRFLNETFSLHLKVDGNIGKITQSVIGDYQEKLGIVEENELGVCYGEKTQEACAKFIEFRYLQEKDYVIAADMLKVDVATIKAFAKTESKEFGFLDNGGIVLLFERHKFYKYLIQSKGNAVATKTAALYPDICNPKPGGYVGGAGEKKRLDRAISIDKIAALKSASYGLYQICGFNYASCGFTSVVEFVDYMNAGEDNQLFAFCRFILADKYLHKALQNRDWPNVARMYNGAGYLKLPKPTYDVRLASNYELSFIK